MSSAVLGCFLFVCLYVILFLHSRLLPTFYCVLCTRYVFEEGQTTNKETGKKKTKARLQELGPGFTMKMRWLQEGTFDTQFGEYEWFHKRKEMDTTRRKFHL